jgi:TonB-dependent receptor
MYASTYDVDYDGTQSITALYLMADLPIGESWNLVVGARLESTQISTTVYGEKDAVWFPPGALAPVSFVGNPGAADVDFNENRALPSISTKWKMAEGVTLRTAYSQTLARQTFRELTPVLQQEYLGGPIFIGNPDLNMSSLDNYDLRLDYTPYEGWLISTSGFYKSVADTIEYSQFEAPGGFVYTSAVNYPEGTMMGVEFETRVQARNIDERLEGLSAGFNATYIDSKVTLPESEQEAFTAIGFPIESRGMTGAPLYLLNANVTYEWMALGTQASIFYTVTGDTLLTGAGIDTGNFVPDVYALPYGTLNFTVQQKLGEHFKLFFQAKNLLNPEIQTAYRSDYLPNGDIVNTSYTAGIDFALGLSFQMNF